MLPVKKSVPQKRNFSIWEVNGLAEEPYGIINRILIIDLPKIGRIWHADTKDAAWPQDSATSFKKLNAREQGKMFQSVRKQASIKTILFKRQFRIARKIMLNISRFGIKLSALWRTGCKLRAQIVHIPPDFVLGSY
jgi:hypothetical protein